MSKGQAQGHYQDQGESNHCHVTELTFNVPRQGLILTAGRCLITVFCYAAIPTVFR